MYIHRGGLTPIGVNGYELDGLFVNSDPLGNPEFLAEPDPVFLPDYFVYPFAKPVVDGNAVSHHQIIAE